MGPCLRQSARTRVSIYSCATNQDCIDLSKTNNLSVSYTRCVKTSPNFEIYKCE